MASPIEITTANLDQYISQNEKPVIVDFGATWSVPSLMLATRLEEAMDIVEDRAIWGRVNIDDEPDLVTRFSLISLPTTLVFWQGQIVKQYMGIHEPDVFVGIVDELSPVPEAPAEETNA